MVAYRSLRSESTLTRGFLVAADDTRGRELSERNRYVRRDVGGSGHHLAAHWRNRVSNSPYAR